MPSRFVMFALAALLCPAATRAMTDCACDAALQSCIFVDPVHGSDLRAGTSFQTALRTLEHAVAVLRGLRDATMNSDACVMLMGGRHQLNDTLHLSGEDGGRDGFRVHFTVVPGQKASISGGIPVSGWSLLDEEHNLWSAPVPRGMKQARQLYVNGKRANRTHSWFNQSAKTQVSGRAHVCMRCTCVAHALLHLELDLPRSPSPLITICPLTYHVR
jgi:hypothetical protein